MLKDDIKEHFKLIKETKEVILKIRIKLSEIVERYVSGEYELEGAVSFIRVRIEALLDFCRFLSLLALMKVSRI